MQIEIHTAEPAEPGTSNLEVEIAIAKLKRYKLQSRGPNSGRTDSSRR
jgi:hypothetical protein